MEGASGSEDPSGANRYKKYCISIFIFCSKNTDFFRYRAPAPARPRELKVEDALLYLDQVIMKFFLHRS